MPSTEISSPIQCNLQFHMKRLLHQDAKHVSHFNLVIATSCTTSFTAIRPITYRPARNRIWFGSSVFIWAPIVMRLSYSCVVSIGKQRPKYDRHLRCWRNGTRWTAAMRWLCSVRISRNPLYESTPLPDCKCRPTMNSCCIYCNWFRRLNMRICSSLRWVRCFVLHVSIHLIYVWFVLFQERIISDTDVIQSIDDTLNPIDNDDLSMTKSMNSSKPTYN